MRFRNTEMNVLVAVCLLASCGEVTKSPMSLKDVVERWKDADRMHVTVYPKSLGVAPYEITDRDVIRRLAGLVDAKAPVRRLGDPISQGSVANLRFFKKGSDVPTISLYATPDMLMFSQDGVGYAADLETAAIYGRLVHKNFDFAKTAAAPDESEKAPP